MTIYDKGLLAAMKEAYKETGYTVAVIKGSMIIQTTFWGVMLNRDAVTNSIKSLIVMHNGEIPKEGTAVNIQKKECSSMILETVLATMEDLAKAYTETGGDPIKLTRITFDGLRLWQTTTDLKMRLVDVDNQQILTVVDSVDTKLVGRYLYHRDSLCSVYVLTEQGLPEDKPLLNHLSEMQWIPVELE